METISVNARRCCGRYQLQYRAVFSWCDEEKGQHVFEGVTRDLAIKGAYIYAAVCPPVRSQILLEVQATKQFCLHAKGEVCRVEAFGASGGFALRIAHGFRVSRHAGADGATSTAHKVA